MSSLRYVILSCFLRVNYFFPCKNSRVNINDLLFFFIICIGNVVTIKLSENQESVLQNDGTYLTMIVETHFQMNYSTGEWKRIKKYRRLED